MKNIFERACIVKKVQSKNEERKNDEKIFYAEPDRAKKTFHEAPFEFISHNFFRIKQEDRILQKELSPLQHP